jgi:hypothetical protein
MTERCSVDPRSVPAIVILGLVVNPEPFSVSGANDDTLGGDPCLVDAEYEMFDSDISYRRPEYVSRHVPFVRFSGATVYRGAGDIVGDDKRFLRHCRSE